MRTLYVFLSLFVLAGCGSNNADGPQPRQKKSVAVIGKHDRTYPIRVVATTGMVADLVRNIGGERVQVEQLMGQDVDPHLYRANTADISKLNNAQVIFYNGLHLEGKMGDTLDRLGKKIPSYGIGEYLEPSKLLVEEGGIADPHIWFDVKLWREAAEVVRDVLLAYDPDNAAEYRAKAEQYHKSLTALDEEVREKVAGIPKKQRLLITSHDAFRYFGRAYGIEVHGVQGISTESEASLKDVENLVTLIVEREVKAVFVESSVSSRNVESIVEGCKARGHAVAFGGELFSDAMGKAGTPEGTYIGMVRHNANTILRALR